jgi:hypothetical protein
MAVAAAAATGRLPLLTIYPAAAKVSWMHREKTTMHVHVLHAAVRPAADAVQL